MFDENDVEGEPCPAHDDPWCKVCGFITPPAAGPDFETAERDAREYLEEGGPGIASLVGINNLARAYLDRDAGVKALAEEVARRAMEAQELRKEIEALRAGVAGGANFVDTGRPPQGEWRADLRTPREPEAVAWRVDQTFEDGTPLDTFVHLERERADRVREYIAKGMMHGTVVPLFTHAPVAGSEDAKRLDWLEKAVLGGDDALLMAYGEPNGIATCLLESEGKEMAPRSTSLRAVIDAARAAGTGEG